MMNRYTDSLISCFLVVLLFNSFKLNSQTNTIQKRIYLAKSNNAYSLDIVETTPGNFVLIGLNKDSVGGQIENRLTLVGVNQYGDLNWKKSYGGNKFAYQRVATSPKYLLKKDGFLYSSPPIADSNARMPGSLIKFNFNGDTIWQKKFYEANTTAQSFFTSVCPSVDNGFLITGSIQTHTPGFNGHPTVGLYVLKTDINGNKLWDHTFYKNNLDQTQIGFDVIQDSASKKIIIVGYQDQNAGGSALLMILDSLGNLLTKKGGGVGTQFYGDGLTTIIKTKDGNFIGGGAVDHPPINSSSYLVKFDINANKIFENEYDTINYDNGIIRLVELPDESILSGGVYELQNKYTNLLNDAVRIMRVNKNGKFVWKKYFDNYTDSNNQDFLAGMCLTKNGQIAFTSFCECLKPSPTTFMFYRTDTSYCDANAIACYNVTGISETKGLLEKNKLLLYPNPAVNTCHLSLVSNDQAYIIDIEVRTILGQLIYSQKGVNNNEYTLDTFNFPSGIYYVSLQTSTNNTVEQKLLIIK